MCIDNETTINLTAVIAAVERITDESPIRRWIVEEDPALGLEQRNIREVPEEWWEELCQLLGIED